MAQEISIIIPNYNGRDILSKNLPYVLKTCPYCEVIVVDDASTDGSADYISKEFPKINLITFGENQGFASAANAGVKASSAPLVLLLNSDVRPTEDFLTKAKKHFENKQTFAVGLADRSHEDGKVIVRGRGGAKFKKGFLIHFAKEPIAGQSFWVSGGSSLIDKKKFLKLGGFDPVYAPFYWEDIDLCFRARKSGDICIFEPQAKVDHYHEEGAIKKNYSKFFIKTVSYKNQFIFVWKNISDVALIMEHILWLPYYFAKAIVSFDMAFIVGFFKALLTVPKLMFNPHVVTAEYQLSDKEVLSASE